MLRNRPGGPSGHPLSRDASGKEQEAAGLYRQWEAGSGHPATSPVINCHERERCQPSLSGDAELAGIFPLSRRHCRGRGLALQLCALVLSGGRYGGNAGTECTTRGKSKPLEKAFAVTPKPEDLRPRYASDNRASGDKGGQLARVLYSLHTAGRRDQRWFASGSLHEGNPDGLPDGKARREMHGPTLSQRCRSEGSQHFLQGSPDGSY